MRNAVRHVRCWLRDWYRVSESMSERVRNAGSGKR